ncbi:MAG TPA: hypothetical protein VFS32_14890, partial [Candidatus Limnocylindrales bacterium]|nr:hypothetical protein [Candidatus Limnocylindrales bacterium]
ILVATSDREGVLAAAGAAPVGIGWEFADDRTNDGQARDRTVDHAVARLFAARARQEAVTLNRGGDFEAAVRRLRRVAARIGSYAGDDERLRDIVASLRADEQQWSRPQSPMLRKVAFASSAYELRSRAPSGEARRRPSA